MARRIVRRSGGRGDASTSAGEYEVRAVVEAKLLGLRLLSLKAHIVTGPPSSIAPLTALTSIPVTNADALVVDSAAPDSSGANGASNGSSASLAEAMKLLEESNAALKQLPG